MTGIVVLLSLISATLVMTNSIYQMEKVCNRTDCIQLLTEQTLQSSEQWNDTMCDYRRQFQLPDGYYVTVCSHQNKVRIIFQELLPWKSTYQAADLNLRQWNYLKRLYKYIDIAIKNSAKKSN